MSANAMDMIILLIEFIGIPAIIILIADVVYYLIKKEHL